MSFFSLSHSGLFSLTNSQSHFHSVIVLVFFFSSFGFSSSFFSSLTSKSSAGFSSSFFSSFAVSSAVSGSGISSSLV